MLGFRVWDCDKKIMVSEPGNFTMNYGGSMSSFCPVTHDFGKLWGDELIRFIPMQSTGLFDMNNEEIFEGDVVITDETFDYPSIIVVKNIIDFLRDDDLHDCDGFYYKLRVMGNIYENPELLEKVKC